MRLLPISFLALITAVGCQAPAPSPGAGTAPVPTTAATRPAPSATTPAPTAAKPAPATVPAAALLVPGRSVGGTQIGEPSESVVARLGKPDASDAAMGKSMATWYAGHAPRGYQTGIFFTRNMGEDETSRARQIRVTSPYFKTAEGLGVGTRLEVLRNTYQLRPMSTYEEAGVRYRTLGADGILFEVNPQDRCTGVIVVRPGDGPPYLSFHPDAKVLD